MNEPTSDVLVERARLEPGARHNLAWSILGHAVVGVAIIAWPRGPMDTPVRNVMTINLSGSPGPNTGGMTQMGGAAAAPVAPEPEPPPPPAAPTPTARPSVPVKPRERAESSSRKPQVTPEPATGNTPVVTGAPGQGFGLSSSGSNIGRSVEMDVSNFCCPEYIQQQVVPVIQRGWDKEQGVRGSAVIAFTIHRDGTVDRVAVSRPSGFFALDNAALRAIARAQKLPPLPAAFTNESLTLRVTFEYQ